MRYALVPFIVIVGVGIAIQAAANTRVGAAAHSPLAGALANFAVGFAALIVVILTGVVDRPQLTGLSQMPAWVWVGGLLGATYVTTTVVAVPKIGAGLTFTAIMCGQMVGAMALDTFGWLDVPRIPLNPWRITGALCLLTGVVLMQWK